MHTQIIVLNGGSSSGKSSLARQLQATLSGVWLAFGADTLIDAMPTEGNGLELAADGSIAIGETFRTLETAWMVGIAAMARSGAHIILDEAFLGGAGSQNRWRCALGDLSVLWVAVRCAPDVAGAREATRPDRVAGMAANQAELVHRGVAYDLSVDTTDTDLADCAATIAEWLKTGTPGR